MDKHPKHKPLESGKDDVKSFAAYPAGKAVSESIRPATVADAHGPAHDTEAAYVPATDSSYQPEYQSEYEYQEHERQLQLKAANKGQDGKKDGGVAKSFAAYPADKATSESMRPATVAQLGEGSTRSYQPEYQSEYEYQEHERQLQLKAANRGQDGKKDGVKSFAAYPADKATSESMRPATVAQLGEGSTRSSPGARSPPQYDSKITFKGRFRLGKKEKLVAKSLEELRADQAVSQYDRPATVAHADATGAMKAGTAPGIQVTPPTPTPPLSRTSRQARGSVPVYTAGAPRKKKKHSGIYSSMRGFTKQQPKMAKISEVKPLSKPPSKPRILGTNKVQNDYQAQYMDPVPEKAVVPTSRAEGSAYLDPQTGKMVQPSQQVDDYERLQLSTRVTGSGADEYEELGAYEGLYIDPVTGKEFLKTTREGESLYLDPATKKRIQPSNVGQLKLKEAHVAYEGLYIDPVTGKEFLKTTREGERDIQNLIMPTNWKGVASYRLGLFVSLLIHP